MRMQSFEYNLGLYCLNLHEGEQQKSCSEIMTLIMSNEETDWLQGLYYLFMCSLDIVWDLHTY